MARPTPIAPSVRRAGVAATNAEDVPRRGSDQLDRRNRLGVDVTQDIRCGVRVRVMNRGDDAVVQDDRIRSPHERRRLAVEADVSDDGRVLGSGERRRRAFHRRWAAVVESNAAVEQESGPEGECSATSHDCETHAAALAVTRPAQHAVALVKPRVGERVDYTLNRMCMMSPSATAWSFPSIWSSPASFTACSEPSLMKVAYGITSARMKPRSRSE